MRMTKAVKNSAEMRNELSWSSTGMEVHPPYPLALCCPEDPPQLRTDHGSILNRVLRTDFFRKKVLGTVGQTWL